MMVFKIKLTVRGNLQASYVFTDTYSKNNWIKNTLPVLAAEHGELTIEKSTLPGLKVGDKCKVIGEGSTIFTIVSLKKYSENRYGFCLDSGWCEEVAKCYSV